MGRQKRTLLQVSIENIRRKKGSNCKKGSFCSARRRTVHHGAKGNQGHKKLAGRGKTNGQRLSVARVGES